MVSKRISALLLSALLLISSCTYSAAPTGQPEAHPEARDTAIPAQPEARPEARDTAAPQVQTGVRAFSLNLRQPLITLCFDDASQTVYDVAFPILRSQGLPATYFFMTSQLDDQWKVALKDLQDHGWEIGSHSRTHPDLTLLSKAELVEEVSQSKADLESAGLKITGFAYPYGIGSDNPAVLRQVKQHYSYARSVDPPNNTPIIQQYALRTQSSTSATRIETMKEWVDSAIANKEWLVILMHTIDDTGDVYSMSPAVLSELAQHIKSGADAGKLTAVTVQEGVNRYGQTGWQPIENPQSSPQSAIAITNGRTLWVLGDKIADYLYDGYEWVQSGELRYYEWSGEYQTINVPSRVSLESISPDRVVAAFTLSSKDGKASVASTVALVQGSPLARIYTSVVRGTPIQLALAKDLARRFSIDDRLLMTDGGFETGMRTYGENAQRFFAFDGVTDLIRIMTHPQRKSHSEYSDYARGEFRSWPISVATELPYAWSVGGIVFDTSDLLAEAESGSLDGEVAFYTGADASPKAGNTGVVLDGHDAVSVRLTPPAQGNYTLSIRQKAASVGSQYGLQIDGGTIFAQTAISTTFGYDNIALSDLSAQAHVVRLNAVSGGVDVDYLLLVPISRSAGTPATVEFPADVAR